jgi:hypothetical protein
MRMAVSSAWIWAITRSLSLTSSSRLLILTVIHSFPCFFFIFICGRGGSTS